MYLSIGNLHNHVRRAHNDGLVLIGFLPIPKGKSMAVLELSSLTRPTGARKDTDNDTFRDFRRRLLHGCLAHILDTLRPFMHNWDVVRCPDQHFRRAIYGLGPYIADYPEQTAVSGVVYNWCVTSVIDYRGDTQTADRLRNQV